MKILIIQHSMDSPPGLLGELITARGWQMDIFYPPASYAHHAPMTPAEFPSSNSGYDALAMTGGPMDADDDRNNPHFARLFDLIDSFERGGKAVIGLCLGAQLLARKHGGRIWRLPQREVGITPIDLTPVAQNDPIFGGLGVRRWIMEWHIDTYDLPPDAQLLGTTAFCRNQLFSVGDASYGCQGHPEVTLDTVRRWVYLDRELPPESVTRQMPEVVEDIADHWSECREFSKTLLDRWLDLAESRAQSTSILELAAKA